jgi:hypothetical protein
MRLLKLSSLHQGPETDHLVSLVLAEKEDHRSGAPFGSDVDLGGAPPESSLELGAFGPPFCPGRMLVSPNYGRVQVVDLPIQLSFGFPICKHALHTTV